MFSIRHKCISSLPKKNSMENKVISWKYSAVTGYPQLPRIAQQYNSMKSVFSKKFDVLKSTYITRSIPVYTIHRSCRENKSLVRESSGWKHISPAPRLLSPFVWLRGSLKITVRERCSVQWNNKLCTSLRLCVFFFYTSLILCVYYI